MRSLSGKPLVAPQMTIPMGEKLAVDLAKLLTDLGAGVTGDFLEGSLSIQYSAPGSRPIVGQVTIANPSRHLVYETFKMGTDAGRSDTPPILNALWWDLGGGREATIAISNTADHEIVADVFLDFGGARHKTEPLEFDPHETKVLSLNKLLAEFDISPAQAPEGGITIIGRGQNPALIGQGSISDPTTGFSTTLNFLLPQDQRGAVFHASGVPIGNPSEDSPYAGMGTFIPHVIVRNLTSSPESVTVTIDYPSQEGVQHIVLPPLPLDAYTTQDISLDQAMTDLPLALPYCSIRIQYSGPPGSTIAEVSSVEQREDLVVDSRLANEGDGRRGSAHHPWHLDDETESIFFLTNMADKDARIVFQVQSGGAQYSGDLKLGPRETRAINIRKLRDEQKPDLQGNKIPANVVDGVVRWIRIGSGVPVMARVVVINAREGMASNYNCGTCCGPTYLGLTLVPSSTTLSVGESQNFVAYARYEDCNHFPLAPIVVTTDPQTSWGIAPFYPTGVVTVSPGRATAQAGGSTRIFASYPDCGSWQLDQDTCRCAFPGTVGTDYADVTVNPTISGPDTVWWFNGQNPSGYATSIMLTASFIGATSYQWNITNGADKISLTNPTSQTVTVTGAGTALSSVMGDASVTVTCTALTGPSGTSSPFALTARGPKTLFPSVTIHSPDANFGYASHIFYNLRDNLGAALPSAIGFNEQWTTAVINDFPGTNWIRGPEVGATTSTSEVDDLIQGQVLGGFPNPVPTAPCSPLLCTTKVDHWGQDWRVGSTTPGLGGRVQRDTLQKYTDHAAHESVVSPAP